MCLINPVIVKGEETQVRLAGKGTFLKCFWYFPEEKKYFPVVGVCNPGALLKYYTGMEVNKLYNIKQFEYKTTEVGFHAYTPSDANQWKYNPQITATQVAITLICQGWWETRDSAYPKMIKAKYIPVVAEIRFKTIKETDQLSNQVVGDGMTILPTYYDITKYLEGIKRSTP